MKRFHFRTYDNDKTLEDFLNKIPNVSDWIRSTLDAVRTGKLVPLENKELDKKIKMQKLVELTRKNHLSLIHDVKIPPEVAIQITNGEISFEEALSPNLKKTIQEEKTAGFDNNMRCSECQHVHLISDKNCSRWDCDCGVRG